MPGPFFILDMRTIECLPAFDAAGVCADYDEDCFLFASRSEHANCWKYAPERGLCPFLD